MHIIKNTFLGDKNLNGPLGGGLVVKDLQWEIFQLCFHFFETFPQLGYDVIIVSASYYDLEKREYHSVFDHMTLIVNIAGQRYLTDVGWGAINEPFDPIR